MIRHKKNRSRMCDSYFIKEGGLLLSHIALQYHRRRRA